MTNTSPVKFEILDGLAWYTFIHKPDPGNKAKRIGPSYKISLVVDGENLEKAKKLGLKIKDKNPKIKGSYVDIKSKYDETKPDRKKPVAVDSQKNLIPSNILIGNGSRVRVRFLPFTYGEGEVTAILKEIQVLELVEYVPTEEEKARKGQWLNKVEGGYKVTDSTEEPAA